MSLAASLVMLAAAALPHAGKTPPQPLAPSTSSAPILPEPPSVHRVTVTAQATAVILRPAVVRLSDARGDRQWQNGDTFFRETRHQGRHVTVDFN